MSSNDGSGSPLDFIVRQAESERAKLVEAREPHVAMLAAIDEQVKALDRVLRAAKPQAAAKPKPKSRVAEGGVKPKWSPEKRDQLVAAMQEDPEQEWTAADVAEAIGGDRTAANDLLKHLREAEVVRKVGVRRREGQRGSAPYLYRLMPDHVRAEEREGATASA